MKKRIFVLLYACFATLLLSCAVCAAGKNDVFAANRSAGKYVALTFDDGPHTEYTAQRLDILKKYDKYFYAVPILYAYSLLYWYRHMSSVTELYLYVFPVPLTVINYLFL